VINATFINKNHPQIFFLKKDKKYKAMIFFTLGKYILLNLDQKEKLIIKEKIIPQAIVFIHFLKYISKINPMNIEYYY
jgi:hypothetical protein